jgi:hypothetical protein
MSDEIKLNQLPIPDAAQRDDDAVEMLRVWIAERGLHCSLKVGMYRESTNVSEERAWGTILADAARHIAAALHKGYDADAATSLKAIREHFARELAEPTSEVSGDFVRKR